MFLLMQQNPPYARSGELKAKAASMTKMQRIVCELNRRAPGYRIGDLQAIRKRIKGLARSQSNVIFNERNVHENFAFHHGGSQELQFNLGIEENLQAGDLRHGLAISLQRTQTVRDLNSFLPKIAAFNEHMRQNSYFYADLKMWHYRKAGDQLTRSEFYSPQPIASNLVSWGSFIFIGEVTSTHEPDFDAILSTYDRLLPLYEDAERNIAAKLDPTTSAIQFRAGCNVKSKWALANRREQTLDVALRHSALQEALYAELCRQFGAAYVGAENVCTRGGRVDLYANKDGQHYIFEIKTALSARGCIREALGQLLDYCCFNPDFKATEAIVVGEPEMTEAERQYLMRLNSQFPVKLSYRSVKLT